MEFSIIKKFPKVILRNILEYHPFFVKYKREYYKVIFNPEYYEDFKDCENFDYPDYFIIDLYDFTILKRIYKEYRIIFKNNIIKYIVILLYQKIGNPFCKNKIDNNHLKYILAKDKRFFL